MFFSESESFTGTLDARVGNRSEGTCCVNTKQTRAGLVFGFENVSRRRTDCRRLTAAGNSTTIHKPILLLCTRPPARRRFRESCPGETLGRVILKTPRPDVCFYELLLSYRRDSSRSITTVFWLYYICYWWGRVVDGFSAQGCARSVLLCCRVSNVNICETPIAVLFETNVCSYTIWNSDRCKYKLSKRRHKKKKN